MLATTVTRLVVYYHVPFSIAAPPQLLVVRVVTMYASGLASVCVC